MEQRVLDICPDAVMLRAEWMYDFGSNKYENSDTPNNPNILQWGCYGKYFDTIPFEENQKVVKMYNLTKEEYESICSELRSIFYIGTCDWCV